MSLHPQPVEKKGKNKMMTISYEPVMKPTLKGWVYAGYNQLVAHQPTQKIHTIARMTVSYETTQAISAGLVPENWQETVRALIQWARF